MRANHLPTIALALAMAGLAGGVHAEGWPQWGGPSRDFVVRASGRLANAWPAEGPKVVFERELGSGYSALLVADGRIYAGFHQGDGEKLAALDAADGKTLWERSMASHYRESHVLQFGKGPNATPLLIGQRLVAVNFGSQVFALDTRDGSVLWERDLIADFAAKSHQFGYATSPLVQPHPAHGDLVILPVGGVRFGAVGLRPADGEQVWQTPPFGISYAAPIAVDLDGEAQLVFMAPTEVIGVRVEDGAIRWRHRHANRFRVNCVSPVWHSQDQTLFVTSQADAGSRLLRLSREAEAVVVEELAETTKVKIFHGNAVRLGEIVYGASDPFFIAFDTVRHRVLWQERGYPEGRFLVADGKAFVLDEQGILSLARLSPRGMIVASRTKVLDKPAWTPPTLVDGRLYLRDTKKLVVLDVRAAPVPR